MAPFSSGAVQVSVNESVDLSKEALIWEGPAGVLAATIDFASESGP